MKLILKITAGILLAGAITAFFNFGFVALLGYSAHKAVEEQKEIAKNKQIERQLKL